jgi:sugar phosphate isomerase/epimerase
MKCTRFAVGIAAVVAMATVVTAEDRAQTPPLVAMDTFTNRPYVGLAMEPVEQLDLIKQMGFAGVTWTQVAAEQAHAIANQAERRGLKLVAVYCGATITPEGALTIAPGVSELIARLAPHGTLIWLHIGGKGPSIGSLGADAPAIQTLRETANLAAKHGLKVAIYPHAGEWTEKFGDALTVANLVDRPNFGVTFNLCHALASGDEANIASLIERAGPRLLMVTINGADTGVTGPKWDRLIQTLDRGSYNVRIVLDALAGIGYKGPIAVQGYGLGGGARTNLAQTMDGWKKLTERAPKVAP